MKKLLGILALLFVANLSVAQMSNPTSVTQLGGTVPGQTVVGGTTSGGLNSSAQLDSSIFAGAQFCDKVNASYTAIGARGGTLDARGFSDPQLCTNNPFSSTGANSFRVVRLRLGAFQVFTSVPWVTPQKGVTIEGMSTAISANLTQSGTTIIACDQSGPEGCGGCLVANCPVFPGTGYTMSWDYPHPPFPSFPPIQILTATNCTTWPRVHMTGANVSAGALTGNATIETGGVGCTAVTAAIGYGGIGSGGTATVTCCTSGAVTQVALSGGSSYTNKQGIYTAVILLGGGSIGGVCTQIPLDAGCDGTGDTGGWLTDGFNSQLQFIQISTNEHQRTFGVYSKNVQEGSGWWHGNCIDLDDNSACTFFDNADVDDSSSGSHATHYYITDVGTNNGSHASPNGWGHVYQAASVFVNITKGSCVAQPFAQITDSATMVAKVTYNGAIRGTLNGGCNSTPPTCYIVNGHGPGTHSGNNSPCTVVIGSNVVNGVTQTNVVTAITGLTTGNTHYPNESHAGPYHIGESTLNCHGNTTRCGGGILVTGTDSAIYDIHCEWQTGRGVASVTGVLGFLGTQITGSLSTVGSCIRFGTGNEVVRAGIAIGIDDVNTADALLYYSNGVDNTQSASSLSEAGNGYTVIDDNNEVAGTGKAGCASACITGVNLGNGLSGPPSDYSGWNRADGYSPGGLLIPIQLSIGPAQDVVLSRMNIGTLGIGQLNGGDTNGFLRWGGKLQLTADAAPISTTTALTATTFLSVVLPAAAQNYSFHCGLLYNQQVAPVSFGMTVSGTGTAPTNLVASGSIATDTIPGAANWAQSGNITTTNSTLIVSGLPSAITTVFPAYVDGTIETAAGGSTLNFGAFTSVGADTITPKRGSYCNVW